MRWIVTLRPADGPPGSGPLLVSDDERVVAAVLREITDRVRQTEPARTAADA